MTELTPEPEARETPTTVEELSIVMNRRFEQVDRRFDDVDRRFEDVQAAIVEQRQYTEFAFGKLEKDMVGVKTEVSRLGSEMTGVKSELGRLERKLDQEMVVVKSGLGRVERKLDRVIDRLPMRGASEPPSPQE